MASTTNGNGHPLKVIKSNDEDSNHLEKTTTNVRKIGKFKLRGKTDDLPQ